jgi:DNA-binding transcriptional MerR regulator
LAAGIIFEPRRSDVGIRLFRLGDLPRLTFDALRENREGLDVDRLAEIVSEKERFDAGDVGAVSKRCLMALYRQLDRGQVAKERRGTVRMWRFPID